MDVRRTTVTSRRTNRARMNMFIGERQKKYCARPVGIASSREVRHCPMSKAVLISIRPKWCELIANGKKTIEVRKSRPNLRPPFKCYIYCTKDRRLTFYRGKRYCYADDHAHNAFDITCNGTIIGEFVCDSIDTYDDDTIFSFRHEDYARWNDFDLDRACIHPEDFQNYSDGEWLHGWHISDLKIYDKPKELKEFNT